MTHTKLPWNVVRIPKNNLWNEGITIGSLTSATGNISVRVADTTDSDEGIKNAEFIVRAVNSHDDLVAALERAGISGKGEIENEWYCPVCESHSFYDYDMEHTEDCFIGQALSKAKEQQ